MAFSRSGYLCVVSGPSGCGKTTLCRAQAKLPGYVYSISCTTRAPRTGEVNGKDYHFLYEEEFLDRVKRKQFLEYAKVHENYYGTLKSTVMGHLEQGSNVLMDLDVQGADKLARSAERELDRWVSRAPAGCSRKALGEMLGIHCHAPGQNLGIGGRNTQLL